MTPESPWLRKDDIKDDEVDEVETEYIVEF